MKVVGRSVLAAFCTRHADARAWIQSWLAEVVKGNRYRLEVVVAYRSGVVSVEWAGTHADYDARNDER